MTIIEKSAYDKLISKKIDISCYKNKSEDYEQFGGTLEAVCEVPWSSIDISSRTHQTRANGTDSGHVAQLAASIKSRGLNFLPYAEWDKKKQKLVILSGHHRMFALQRNFLLNEDNSEDSGLNMGNELYPIIVVRFPDVYKREEFLQNENNHLETKGHSKADAVKFLNRFKEYGYFQDSSDLEEICKKAYPLLEKHYPKIQTSARREVVSTVFDNMESKIKKWQSVETRNQIKPIFKASAKTSGAVIGDVCYVSSEENAVGKAVFNAMRDRAYAIDNGHTTNPIRIKVITHFKNTSMDSLRDKRKEFLAQMNSVNKCLDKKYCQIEEIALLPQILLPVENRELIPMVFKNGKDGFKI